MVKQMNRKAARAKRQARVRYKISGTATCPRLNVFRSSKHIYAQLIDDVAGVTLASASSMDKGFEGNGGNKDGASRLARLSLPLLRKRVSPMLFSTEQVTFTTAELLSLQTVQDRAVLTSDLF